MTGRPKVALSSVVIKEEKMEQVKAAISQLQYQDLIFKDWGFEEVFEKGTAVSLLFYGIPGTGKTLMAQAIADHLGYALKVVGTAEIESSEPGGAERTIKKVFAEANASIGGPTEFNKFVSSLPKNPIMPQPLPQYEGPELLCFDECDSLLYDRNAVGVILGAQINTLLSELERFKGVVIFTTNRLGKLDPALERRITAKIEFDFPDKNQRALIWRRMLPAKAPLAKDVDIEKLAEYPLAGGNIKNAVLNGAREAAYTKKTEISMACFVKAIEKEVEGLNQFLSAYEQSNKLSRLNKQELSNEDGMLKVADRVANKEAQISGEMVKLMKSWKGEKDGSR